MPRRNLKFSFKPCVIGMSALALVIAPVSLDFTDFPVKLSTAIAKGGGGGAGRGGKDDLRTLVVKVRSVQRVLQ